MKVIKNNLSPSELSALENYEAQVETNKAIIDYIAMMADVEIPVEEDDNYELDV